MKIAAFQKQSLIEYPGKISAVIFLTGCQLRCQFCYVPHLVLPEKIKKIKGIPKKNILTFLKQRKNFLEAVAISGGEATINSDLLDFIKKIKKIGYFVELETNGTNFKMLKNLVENKLVDYIAMDIKQKIDFKKYFEITGKVLTKEMFENIKKSINYLLKGNVDYEFRTTLVKEFHKKEDIVAICKKIKGANVYFLQNFTKIESGIINGKSFTPFAENEIQEIIESGKKYVNIRVRQYL